MLAFRLLRHSILQVFGNLKAALILSTMPFLTVLVASFLIGLFLVAARGNEIAPAIGVVAALFLAALMILSFISLATSWHRFVLLAERPRFLRPIRRVEWRYLGASLRLGLIVVLAAIPILFSGALLVAAVTGNLVALMIGNLIFGFAVTVLWLRLGTGLAGAALGVAKPLTTAWRATRQTLGTLMLLALFYQLLQLVLNLTTALPGLAGLIATAIVGWLGVLLSLSLITTLWGHFVEGRALR